nr:hypothetical protein [Chloroflexota bacterium]
MLNFSDYEDTFDPGAPRRKKLRPNYKPKRRREEIAASLADKAAPTGDGFNPTFSASRHEHEWIVNYLGPFYDDHQITDVLRLVKGGKEANVYCCAAHPALGAELLAAKVYRPRMFRNLRNDALYRRGREILDTEGKAVRDPKALVAAAKKTSFGQELLHTSWLAHEGNTLRLLVEAGADVPRIFARGENAILMTYLGDRDSPAPTLNHVTLPPRRARPLFDRLLHNVELMLAHRKVHGDLSAYNVLYWEGDICIIDFPQAIDPFTNPAAFGIFRRDVTRLCEYFDKYGISANAGQLARTLWDKHVVAKQEPELPTEDVEE